LIFPACFLFSFFLPTLEASSHFFFLTLIHDDATYVRIRPCIDFLFFPLFSPAPYRFRWFFRTAGIKSYSIQPSSCSLVSFPLVRSRTQPALAFYFSSPRSVPCPFPPFSHGHAHLRSVIPSLVFQAVALHLALSFLCDSSHLPIAIRALVLRSLLVPDVSTCLCLYVALLIS